MARSITALRETQYGRMAMAIFRFISILLFMGLTACSSLEPQPGEYGSENYPEVRTGDYDLIILSPTAAGIPEAVTGKIQVERWDNMSSYQLSTLLRASSYPDSPDATQRKSSFFYRPQVDNIGARLRAELFPQVDGLYSFTARVKGSAKVWLSTNESSSNKRLIIDANQTEKADAAAIITETTPIGFMLSAGQRYFVEVQFKSVAAKDFFELKWLVPNTDEAIRIPGEVLAHYPAGYEESDQAEFGYGYGSGYQAGYQDAVLGIEYDASYPAIDSDLDSIPDKWEIALGYDPLDATDAALDDDGDGLTTAYEYWAGTEPLVIDSDGDQVPDGFELQNGGNPTSSSDSAIMMAAWTATGGTGTTDGSDSGDSSASGSGSGEVITAAITLNWSTPNEREDGTQLSSSEIAKFIVNYGTSADNLSSQVEINDPGATRFTISDLIAGQTYYMTMITVDTNNLLSQPSQVVQVTAQ
jgi:hypothetical protein